MIEYTLKKSDRARSMRLAVLPGGAVVVTIPRGFAGSYGAIERFIARSERWITARVHAMRAHTVIPVLRADIPRLKREAQILLEERCAYFAGLYGYSYTKITIRAQKTRWGSCSKKGALSFNYKIVLLPRHLQDAIVVHEICHLGAFDHSKRFWGLVSRAVPDHRLARAELKKIHFAFT